MKKIILIFLVSMVAIGVSAVDFEFSDNLISITGDFSIKQINTRNTTAQDFQVVEIEDCSFTGQPGSPVVNVWSQLAALPETGNFTVSRLKYEYEYLQLEHFIMPFDWEETAELDSNIYSSDQWYPESVIKISDPAIMRDSRFCQISIFPFQYNPARNEIRVLIDLDIALQLDETISVNPKTISRNKISKAFKEIYSSIDGFSPERNESPGVYLIIAPEACISTLEPLKQWKERLGFRTQLVSLNEIGNSELNIKNYIQNAYDTWEFPPDYVILAGDVNGSFIVPAFYIEGYYLSDDVTDHSYALLEGEDYFPDILIGRLSFQSLNQLQTIINKIIFYESAPYQGAEWFNRAIMTSYIDDYWQNFYSAWETKRAVREKLLDFTYSVVDTFYVPFQNSTTQLMNLINEGCTFINYRGAGGPSYWWSGYGPLLSIDDVNLLNNGFMLPMVTSITCGGGNFADEWYDTSLGETWLAAGSPSSPKGGIGFIGPSELDTKTPFNNANDMGIYNGITQEGLLRCGEMLLRGKMELYNNYPNGHDMDGYNDALDSDQFYFYVYNLLGDPGLAVWTDTPEEITLYHNDLIPAGSNFLEIAVAAGTEDLADFTVALTNDNELLTTATTNSDGIAYLNYEFESGSYSITASKYGFIPKTENVDATDQSIIGLVGASLSPDPMCGSQIQLELVIQNLSDIEATDIIASLVCEDPQIEIISSGFSVPFLEAQDEYSNQQYLDINPLWLDGCLINVFLEISASLGEFSYIIPITLQAPELLYTDHTVSSFSGNLEAGETCQLWVELLNSGSLASGVNELRLMTESELVIIESDYSTLNNIDPGNSGSQISAFTISVSELAITGESVPFELEVHQTGEVLQTLPFNLQIGTADEQSPTFSSYGYKAFESNDSGNFYSPEYDWIEISVDNGGPGSQIYGGNIQPDGFTDIIELPFPFTYYGIEYDQMAVCSNGYLALGEFNAMFFRNRTIPSGAGPAAMIAPFWDHIKWGDIFGYYDEEEHRFIIQWEDWQNAYNTYQHETFEVILYDPAYYETPTGDGPILFQFKEINNVDQDANYATIGIEDHTQTEGLLITYADIYPETVHQIEDETAILFTTGEGLYTDSSEDEIPGSGIKLLQNYPNPFNPVTTITFSLTTKNTERVELVIYNIKGQKVKTFTFLNGSLGTSEVLPFTHFQTPQFSVNWNGTDELGRTVPSGIYFYRLSAGDLQETKKMILMK